MMVAALSTAGFSQYIAASSDVSASQQAWQSLGQSLAQGNLSAAENAFKTYSQLNPAPASSSSTSVPSQLTTDMAALGSALSSGNLSSAQSAYATVQNDLKTTPSQAVANAESVAAQTVQWMDDLLSLSDSNSSSFSTSTTDPVTAMLDSAYGLNSFSSTTNPLVVLLESKYGDSSTASTGSASSAGTAASTAGASSTASAPSTVSSGNAGSSASVNAYA